MTSLTDLRDVVDVVIGVDTHVDTHTAAAVDARTGAVLDQMTVDTTVDGYEALVEFAEPYPLRAWAIEGTGGHGAGLARRLSQDEEYVVELDRPERARRRNGAKSDPLDAIRAAREALARPKLGTPRASGDRQALSVLLAARRSAVDASTVAQKQLFSLVIAAPEVLRARFRGQKIPTMLRYRLNPYGDRQLNRALHTMVITRITCHQPTRDYIARRTAQGKTAPEIKRYLKRYIARDLYRLLEHGRPATA